jgi:hypothetical protein
MAGEKMTEAQVASSGRKAEPADLEGQLGAIVRLLGAVVRAASEVRGRFPRELWNQVGRLDRSPVLGAARAGP